MQEEKLTKGDRKTNIDRMTRGTEVRRPSGNLWIHSRGLLTSHINEKLSAICLHWKEVFEENAQGEKSIKSNLKYIGIQRY